MSGALATAGEESALLAPARRPAPCEPTDFPCALGGYRLLGVLGKGGMATVYEAEHLATGRRVALKMLEQQLDSSEMRLRFLREGRLAASINHPNSLYIFGSEEIDGLPVITMEIAGGGTLKDKLKKRGPLPVTEAVDAILDVIAGLEAAFAAGVLHRDVKPSNCFVGPDGAVKVGDFGLSVSTLARDDSHLTATGVIMGTPAYAPPEQLRGDELDVRADIYSVGATLFTLLTDRAPFEGDNVVQVIANAVNEDPKPLRELRDEVPPALERAVARCLRKEPDGRYADYMALRNALLPFSSREPEPASMLVRASAGWIDYLIALLPPYLALMLLVGGEELIVRPLVERTLYSARYYFALFGFGFLYFAVAEGLWGAGLGKWLKGLRVVRRSGRRPGLGRALIRAIIPIASVEAVRMPLTMAFISEALWTGLQTAMFVIAAIVCGWIPGLLALRARRENGYATLWDLASGTKVVVKPKGAVRPSLEPAAAPETPAEGAKSLGPYRLIRELVPGEWIVAADPVLRRGVWLLRRASSDLSVARRNVARPGRLRWLQKVQADEAAWDAFEATQGAPLSGLVEDGRRLPWSTLRHWLHDLASELWDATRDQTLPAELSLDHVWISAEGRAILLDQPWPKAGTPAERISIGDLGGQQRFLHRVGACVESTGLPLHARPVLKNLEDGRFEKLSYFTGTLRGLLERPAEVSRGIRAGSLFVLPLYVWIAVVVGRYHDKPWDDPLGILVVSALTVLCAIALTQLLLLPLRATASQWIFRLAVVNKGGELATASHLLTRWAIVWLPLFLPVTLLSLLTSRAESAAVITALLLLLLWIGAAVHAALHPHRGLHDRLADSWVVRR
jgi:uncharacterized RDD family membrane protein YckC/tRNA A-37 threonylcarbamoyl transferase component Bud32